MFSGFGSLPVLHHAIEEAVILLPLVDHYVLSKGSGFGVMGSVLNTHNPNVMRFQVTPRGRESPCYANSSDPIQYFAGKWSGV